MANPCLCKQKADKKSSSSPSCFGNLWLFEDFNNTEYDLLKSIGRQRTIAKGQAVFFQGEPSDEIFLIKYGRVKLSKCFDDGSEVILDFRKSGELFGEDIFTSTSNYPMSAWAMEETVTCGAKRSDLENLLLENPSVSLSVMKNMSKRIANLTSRIESMTINSLDERLYQILLHIAQEHSGYKSQLRRIPFPLTHEDLGFLVNAHRVSITKAVNKLIETGKIIKEGKYFSLPTI